MVCWPGWAVMLVAMRELRADTCAGRIGSGRRDRDGGEHRDPFELLADSLFVGLCAVLNRDR